MFVQLLRQCATLFTLQIADDLETEPSYSLLFIVGLILVQIQRFFAFTESHGTYI